MAYDTSVLDTLVRHYTGKSLPDFRAWNKFRQIVGSTFSGCIINVDNFTCHIRNKKSYGEVHFSVDENGDATSLSCYGASGLQIGLKLLHIFYETMGSKDGGETDA